MIKFVFVIFVYLLVLAGLIRNVLYNLFLVPTDFNLQFVFQRLFVLLIFLFFCFPLSLKFASYVSTNNFQELIVSFFSGCFFHSVCYAIKGF